MTEKDYYFVAVKGFLQNNKGELLITKDRFGDWDIPGGRLTTEDFSKPLEIILKNKLQVELGDKVLFEIGEPVIFMRHERNEVHSLRGKEKRRIFAIGYKVKYVAGEIQLGKNHEEYKWVDLNIFIPEKYFTGGWLSGIKELQKKIVDKS